MGLHRRADAVSVGKNGQIVLTKEIRTAEAPARIELIPDRKTIKADGVDLSFVTVKVVDKNGTVVPYADNLIKFEISGAGFIAGVDNGNQISHESFKGKQRKAFHGLALAIVQAKMKPGRIVLRATAGDLFPVHASSMRGEFEPFRGGRFWARLCIAAHALAQVRNKEGRDVRNRPPGDWFDHQSRYL